VFDWVLSNAIYLVEDSRDLPKMHLVSFEEESKVHVQLILWLSFECYPVLREALIGAPHGTAC
jgi:hypothetical protein